MVYENVTILYSCVCEDQHKCLTLGIRLCVHFQLLQESDTQN